LGGQVAVSSTVIWLKYPVEGKHPSKQVAIDLATQDTFILPKPLGEFYRSVSFIIKVKPGTQVEASEGSLTPLGNRRYRLTIERGHRGMTGARRLHLSFRIDAETYPLQITLPIYPEHLTVEQFHCMLDDMSHWVFSALASPIKLDIGHTERFTSVLRSQQIILDLIGKRIDELGEILQRIAVAPRKQIRKQYYPVAHSAGRQDAVTVRWMARNPADSRTLAFRNVSSYSVYENRFVLFFISQLERRLVFLQRIADRTVREKEKEIKDEKRYHNIDRVRDLEKQRQEASGFGEKCLELRNRLHRFRNLEFLRGVAFDPNQFCLNYPLALTQDFNYSRVFTFYRELGREKGIERLDRLRGFVEGLLSVGVEATSKVYEYWIFFAIYNELLRLHFHPEGEDELLQVIDSDLLTPRLKPGSSVTLTGDKVLHGSMQIRLYYEREYGKRRDGRPKACPDVTMEVWRSKHLVARFIFDAKYKDYADPTGKNSEKGFYNDLSQVATKYQDGRLVSVGVIDKSQGAFLLHVNTYDDWFENYGAFIQRSRNGPWKRNAYRYGFVPVVPGNLKPLRTLLAMLFLIKLQADLDICWMCGSTDVRKEVYHSQYGTIKENRRICQRCGHEWWVTPCSCGFPLPKGEFSFTLQHKSVQPSSPCTGYFCPGCGKCVCGASIEQVTREDG